MLALRITANATEKEFLVTIRGLTRVQILV